MASSPAQAARHRALVDPSWPEQRSNAEQVYSAAYVLHCSTA